MKNGNGKGVSIIKKEVLAQKVGVNKVDTFYTNDNGDFIVRRAIIENTSRMANFEEWQWETMFHFQNLVIDELDDWEAVTSNSPKDSLICASMSIKTLSNDNYIPKVSVLLEARIKGRKEGYNARKLTKH
mgnify:FL=1|jgi:hypothetical protein